MHTHRSQGYGSRCLVKAEVNFLEYKHHTRFLRSFCGGCKTKTIYVGAVFVRYIQYCLYVPDKDLRGQNVVLLQAILCYVRWMLNIISDI